MAGSRVRANSKHQEVKEKKDAQADVDASSMLPENQAIDLPVSQMFAGIGGAEGMRKVYADDVMVISGACGLPLF